jgi:hypothetical protein
MNDPATTELNKIRFDYAWRHFEFHAAQRTKMFHFFVLMAPFLLGGYFYLLRSDTHQQPQPLVAAFVALMGLFLSLVFLLLDFRNRQLYLVSYENLKLIEANFLYQPNVHPLNRSNATSFGGIISEEIARYGSSSFWSRITKHRVLLATLYTVTAIVFAVMTFLAICLHNQYFDLKLC